MILPSRIPQIKPGSEFLVLTHDGDLIPAVVKKTLLTDSCLFYEDLDMSFGLLDAKEELGWNRDVDAMIAIVSSFKHSNSTGKVLSLSDTSLRSQCLSMIRASLPDSEQYTVTRSLSIVAPDKNLQYFFLGVNHYTKSNLRLAGDQALFPTGFLFHLNHGKPQLILTENYLSNIFTVSDLDNDGEYEFSIYSGGFGGGSYEIRIFNG